MDLNFGMKFKCMNGSISRSSFHVKVIGEMSKSQDLNMSIYF